MWHWHWRRCSTAKFHQKALKLLSQTFTDLVENWRACLLTQSVGFLGALIFVWIQFPLPWVTGPVFFTVILALSGTRLWTPDWLRDPSMVVLGVLFGTAISPNFVELILGWWLSMISMVLYVLLSVPLLTAYLVWLGKYDFKTAFIASAPGGIIPMTLLGQELGADDRTIAIMQSERLILTVLTIPIAFRLFAGYVPSGNVGTGGSFDAFLPTDILPMLVACAAGWIIARLIRLPAPSLMGPMIAVGILRLSGFVESDMPDSLVAIAQVFIGISIALRFNGSKIREILITLGHGAVVGILMVIIAVVFAAVTALVVDSTIQSLILAFAPGGFAEMALIGFGLGVAISFVITHQLVRYFFVVLSIPVFLLFVGKNGGQE